MSGADVGNEFLRKLRALGEADVLRIGDLPESIVRRWTNHVVGNLEVVITGRQRAHYLARHPDMLAWERRLADTVLDPDEVHQNRSDPSIATFYNRLDASHYLRASVVMQAASGMFKHSVITFRLARTREVSRDRPRRRWVKR